jgi:hypothetical protein
LGVLTTVSDTTVLLGDLPGVAVPERSGYGCVERDGDKPEPFGPLMVLGVLDAPPQPLFPTLSVERGGGHRVGEYGVHVRFGVITVLFVRKNAESQTGAVLATGLLGQGESPAWDVAELGDGCL